MIALGFVSLFTDAASSMVTSILPIFIVYVLNDSIDKLGFVVAVSTFVSYAFRIIFGYLSDKYRVVKPFVAVGYTLSAAIKPLLYFTYTWQQIAALRGLERMGKAIRSAPKDSLISSYAEGNSGKTFGFYKTMDVTGELLGAVIAFVILFYCGKNEEVFRNIFALSIIPGILAVVIVMFFVRDVAYKKKEKKFDLRQDYELLPTLFIYFGFIFFIFNESFFMIKAKEAGIGIEYIPLLVIVLNLTQMMLSFLIGVKIDEWGTEPILLGSFIFGIFSMISLYLNWIILGFILLGIFIVGSLNAIRAYISDNAYNKGTVYGILYGGVAIFGALGATAMGLIWKKFGEGNAIIFSITGLLLILCVYLIILRKNNSVKFIIDNQKT